ncbi:MAG: secondary thiamine-phosphate synthase enzyme YjbQ [Candidatus Moranbacteria bacterium]|jgi:secondary thiamine-phosphate synthase enzyme|nr:secondary thiamine-phosphate synthase enzyme YjbQ [Candidatus Moranbacteria bacterium]
MQIIKQKFEIQTSQQIEFIDITKDIRVFVQKTGIADGQITVFSPHSTASIAMNHNEPMLIKDFIHLLYKLAPIDERYNHDMFELTKKSQSDGRSNGHSHCKNLILGSSQNILIEKGKILMGKRQSVFFVELDGARKRDYYAQIIGE